MNSPSCVLYFCLSSFCSCWKFVLSLIYASVGYGLSTVGCSFPLTRRVEDYFWGILGLLLPFFFGCNLASKETNTNGKKNCDSRDLYSSFISFWISFA
jgi:hypothetical protein